VPAVWHPELVGKIRGYPKTQETFDRKQAIMRQQILLYNAEGITGRNGVPDGWAGKKALINEINAASEADAKAAVDELEELGRFEPDNVESRAILEEAFKVVYAEKHTPEEAPVPLYAVKDRLAAMKMIWEVVQKKPLSRQEVGVTKAEDFLAALAAKPAE